MTTTKTETTQTTPLKNTPNFNVHAVVPDGRGTRIGSRIGVVFNHKNGQGFSMYLDAQPIPLEGRIELVAYPYEPKP